MTNEIRWLRKQYPMYPELSDEQLREAYYRQYPERLPVVYEGDMEQKIYALMETPEAGIIKNWWNEIKTRNNAQAAQVRLQYAVIMESFQKLYYEAKTRQLQIGHLEKSMKAALDQQIAIAENLVEVAHRATAKGLPIDQYVQVQLDHEIKTREIERMYHEDELLIKFGLAQRMLEYQLINEVVERISELTSKINSLRASGNIGPEVREKIDHYERELTIRRREYDAALAISSGEPSSWGQLRKVAEGTPNPYGRKR